MLCSLVPCNGVGIHASVSTIGFLASIPTDDIYALHWWSVRLGKGHKLRSAVNVALIKELLSQLHVGWCEKDAVLIFHMGFDVGGGKIASAMQALYQPEGRVEYDTNGVKARVGYKIVLVGDQHRLGREATVEGLRWHRAGR